MLTIMRHNKATKRLINHRKRNF